MLIVDIFNTRICALCFDRQHRFNMAINCLHDAFKWVNEKEEDRINNFEKIFFRIRKSNADCKNHIFKNLLLKVISKHKPKHILKEYFYSTLKLIL